MAKKIGFSKKEYLIVGFLVFVIILAIIVVYFVLTKKDIPDYPVFMFDNQIYLVTSETIKDDNNILGLGKIDESTNTYDLNKNNQGFYVPVGSDICKIINSESDDSMTNTLVIKISKTFQFGVNSYSEGNYYVSRKIVVTK